MTSRLAFPAEYRRFVHEFNHGWFWASHETLEDAWRRTRSEFYHGLILLASVFVHVQRENPHGIAAQLDKAITALSPYRPQYLGMDVAQLIRHLHRVQAAVRRAPPRSTGGAREISAPVLELEKRLIQGTEPELEAE